MLSESEYHLVVVAFQSMDHGGIGLIPLSEVKQRYFAHAHPRVKEGKMAPSAARDTLDHHFGLCAADHDGGITFDEFLAYHEKIADEAYDEQVGDIPAFTERTITELWRLGDVLLPTGVRPLFSISQAPSALYAVTPMTLVWVERRSQQQQPAVASSSSAKVTPTAGRGDLSALFVLRGIKDVVRPTFSRGDLPDELQGYFAYPEELTGMAVEYLPPQISMQNWYDFCWEYADNKYCGVEGIISTRVDRELLPAGLRQFLCTHSTAIARQTQWIPSRQAVNPMYKKTSTSYGVGVTEECRRIHYWKVNTFAGKQYGNQYHGLCGKQFSKAAGPVKSSAATGMNI
ncbi:hypothetical protein ABB37_05189 [Leptomonas pyrrhocoris]|uniref:EF-hand domain-containing protein n=1 Tax=Leptomonas pyrrhocoris TaxID=157538 RepID=A0A0M9G1B1_LEPPY|nr:hypothetical protein ABB37_05189 [Leptomonas pyrrhocoris]XP_015658652.1 hypothetical protein ABB37_05189 [Leptomonas pyrrhocoris]XP_015658653.1 hypothetical protein ABB37_05189 [Leptomonas pyrrhocoris]KPA80212.1 hypothetical protein ABB37_05189 [Leptomonas pyrrhocoris]KPA80213.1 hypothetical protein ABB37_05189 [Leptomonas pyrrhocoris]KPA80214.1 hypothetical protein ABB37_05189 [Leptomonas pyrrhocoris]|eukprot:XP_015658651.1 hypothetical protein ABB37_05189 [Leptomonas pyrrhocoris]